MWRVCLFNLAPTFSVCERQSPPLKLKPKDLARLNGQEASGSFWLPSPLSTYLTLELQAQTTTAGFCMNPWDLNPKLHACSTDPLPPDPSPQLPLRHFETTISGSVNWWTAKNGFNHNQRGRHTKNINEIENGTIWGAEWLRAQFWNWPKTEQISA